MIVPDGALALFLTGCAEKHGIREERVPAPEL